MRLLLVTVLAALLGVCGAFAFEVEGESLVMVPPEGYKIVFTKQKKGLEVSELIPEGDSLSDWQEMLALQVYPFGGIEMSKYELFYKKQELPSCDETTSTLVRKGQENHYEVAMFKTSCSAAPPAERETVLTKVILGTDRTFLAAKTWLFEPGEDEMETWTQYLNGVHLCDTRIAERTCSKDG